MRIFSVHIKGVPGQNLESIFENFCPLSCFCVLDYIHGSETNGRLEVLLLEHFEYFVVL